jgi:K+-transporting ATPase ATPase C chain
MAVFRASALRNHLAGLRMLLVFTVITGILYPLAVTGVAQAAFPHQANGSRIEHHGKTVGSSLIGQNFTVFSHGKNTGKPDPKWFQPRPSSGGYDPLASGASNLGPNDKGLVKTIEKRRKAVAAFDHVAPHRVPPDAVTASGSGLDPDISTAYAYEQVDRVAKARGLSRAQVRQLVTEHVQDRVIGILGTQRVNVVDLDNALSAAAER